MIYIGSHISSSGGFMAMGDTIKKLGGNTFAFFTRNPRGGVAKPIDEADAEAFMEFCKLYGMGPLVAHAPYTMNLCSDKPDIRRFAKEMFLDDMKRMSYIPGNYYNFHPGSHVGQGIEVAMPIIIDVLNEALTPDLETTVLLEIMAGKGSEVGRNFEEIKSLIDGVNNKDKIGVCLDTCHIWEGGYDIVSNLDGVIDEFDSVIGLNYLKAIHFNDSKNDMSAHKDRHELIGKGCIGETALKAVVQHEKLQNLPFILETPNTEAGYAQEIAMIKAWMV